MPGCTQSTLLSNMRVQAHIKDTHRSTGHSWELKHNTRLHTQANTHTHLRVWVMCSWLRLVHLPVSLHLSLSLSQMQMFTFPCDSLILRDHYLWHIADTESWWGHYRDRERAHSACHFSLKDNNPHLSVCVQWMFGHWLTLLWCSPGRWLQCPPGMTAALPVKR